MSGRRRTAPGDGVYVDALARFINSECAECDPETGGRPCLVENLTATAGSTSALSLIYSLYFQPGTQPLLKSLGRG